nr:hypothetical protein [Tanacetum cinerariifolium]
MGQLAEEVHTRETCKLPSYPDLNPKHKPGGPEHVNMVTSLRNGKTYNNDIKIPSVSDFSHDVEDFVTDDEIVVEGRNADNVKSDSELDIWETFKQVKINLPLIDAIKQIPVYAKFLKYLCTQKRKLKATLPKKIDLTEHVSAVLSISLPPKFKDPGAPLISVVVGNITIKKALLDLGASINILPASLVDNMNLDHTLENLHYVDIEKELFDGMMFREKEEEFQLIEEEFLVSLKETPLQSQQVQQSTLNEVQEYVDCLLVHQDVLLRARGSNKADTIIWNATLPIKVNIHIWRAAMDQLPTCYNLDAWGIDLDSTRCHVCNGCVETSKHLFIDSMIARGLCKMISSSGS